MARKKAKPSNETLLVENQHAVVKNVNNRVEGDDEHACDIKLEFVCTREFFEKVWGNKQLASALWTPDGGVRYTSIAIQRTERLEDVDVFISETQLDAFDDTGVLTFNDARLKGIKFIPEPEALARCILQAQVKPTNKTQAGTLAFLMKSEVFVTVSRGAAT